jgi:hypothetical protein
LRFHVRLVEGREHALRIANALGGHVKRLNLKAVAYLDVSPSDAGWSELVRALVVAGLKVLIAVREEDFRRANIAVGDFDYSEVVLDSVTKDEAEQIFSALRTHTAVSALDFQEAWARFAVEQKGPLLEFTHLASEGESLASRITTQIYRIQNDAAAKANGLTDAHIELLALAAVANETGARVLLPELYGAAGVNPLEGPLKVLENEYLVRVEGDAGSPSLAGLHTLRSKAVVNALFGDAPGVWEKYAVRVLPLIVDEDLESFLLSAFSRRPDFSDVLFEPLRRLTPRSWTHAACIVRSLIWEGVSRYERRNRAAILEAMAKYGGAWCFVCDSFVGIDGDSHRELLGTTNEVLKANIQTIPLTPKAEIFELFVAWSSDATAPAAPQRPIEWANIGEIAHWLGHTKSSGTLRTAIESILPSPLPIELHVEELGLFVSGRAQIADAAFLSWHDAERDNITATFLRETDSVHVTDDGREVKVYFSVPLADCVTEGRPDAHDWHGQTMKRIRLLRLLFPHRESFGAQGIGLELFVKELQQDPTFKQIPAKSMPFERSTRLNGIFISLVAYRHNRPNTWNEYTCAVVAFREAVSDCFRKLHRGWAGLLSESPPRPSSIRALPSAEIDRITHLSKLPMFPRSAVDEWGFLSEEKQSEKFRVETMQQRSLRRFETWRQSFRDFESSVGMFTSQILSITIIYLAEHKGHVPDDGDDMTGHLLLNLGFAWQELRRMQREFRTRFGDLFEHRRLDELEAHERSNFRHVWAVTFAMRYERRRHLSSISQMMESEIARRKAHFLQTLRTEINSALEGAATVVVRETPWCFDGAPHLCIACDHRSVEGIESRLPNIVAALWRAAQAGGWRALEWKPLEVEWPQIALVNLVRGKALMPACATISTALFFVESERFEVKPLHYTAAPMNPEAFAAGGFSVWESPLLRAAVALQGNVVAFVVTNARFYQLAKLIFEQGLEQVDTDRILARFSSELRTVLRVAQRSYAEMVQILAATDSQDKARWAEGLRLVCRSLLFEVDEDATVSLTLETFLSWMEEFQNVSVRFKKTISEIVTFALVA